MQTTLLCVISEFRHSINPTLNLIIKNREIDSVKNGENYTNYDENTICNDKNKEQ
jgi:hypothetical protein